MSTGAADQELTDRSLALPAAHAEPATINLEDVGRVLLRRWRTILVGILAATALAAAAHLLLTSNYSATTRLVVSPLVTDPSVSAASRDLINIATEREIVQSSSVAAMALERVGRDPAGAEELIDNLGVVAPDNSFVLRITVTDSSAEGAAELANAVAEAYLDFRRQGGQEMVVRLTEQLDGRIAELADQPGDLAQEQVRALTEQRQALALYGQNPGRIIGRAIPPSDPSGPGLPIFLLAGLVGGALVGVGLALLRERTDGRVRTAGRLERYAELPATVLESATGEESLRWLRRSVVAAAPRGGTVVLLSSAPSGVDLAEPLAQVSREAGLEVEVMDANALSAAEIDGWTSARPTTPAAGDEQVPGRHAQTSVLLLDATRVTSRTSISELAESAEVAVLVITPRDQLAEVRALRDIALGAPVPLLAVLVRRSPTGRRTS